jgi:membrane protease YdiL (CAAX protease family)
LNDDVVRSRAAVLECRDMPAEIAHPPFSRKRVAWLLFVLVLASLNYASRFSGGEVPANAAYQYTTSIGALVQYAIMLGILLLIARGQRLSDVFALRRPDSWRRAGKLAAIALMSIWAVGAVLSPFLNANKEQGLVPKEWDSSRAGAFVAFFLTVTILAPVVEELTFRGLGYTLFAPYGSAVAIVVTGLLFGLAHGLLIALPVLAMFGFLLGWLRAKTASVYPGMLLHGTFNGIALLVSVIVLG